MSHIAFEGNLTAEPEGGYGKESGKAYAKLNAAENHRAKAQDGTWSDGPTSFYRVTLFGRLAENALNSFHKGDTVVVVGDLTVTSYTRQDGTPATSNEVVADLIGGSPRYGTVSITRNAKSSDTQPE